MKPSSLFPLLALCFFGCAPQLRESILQVRIERDVSIGQPQDVRISQKTAMNTAFVMLTSDGYAAEVLRRLKRSDAEKFVDSGEIRRRLELRMDEGSDRIGIGFAVDDSGLAKRVVALYADSLVHDHLSAIEPGFRAEIVASGRASP